MTKHTAQLHADEVTLLRSRRLWVCLAGFCIAFSVTAIRVMVTAAVRSPEWVGAAVVLFVAAIVMTVAVINFYRLTRNRH